MIKAPRFRRLRFLLPCLVAATALNLFHGCGATRAGYSSPDFKLMQQHDNIEIRGYPALTVAVTSMAPGEDRGDGFRRLFQYISGANAKAEKIAMTTPVLVGTEAGEEASMQFVVPDAVAAQGAPAPEAASVAVRQIEGGTFGVLRFKGSKDPRARAEALETLRSGLGSMNYEATGEAIYAYYDPPWTPEALRRNEVMLRIRPE